ncbi:oxygen regulatory protein NreC [Flavobacterium noncentrifugens]|uniref:Two component transcriptional regulator, LuxR family n=1 Tax=Flavobacterium noncentrifugens TaxID=1128970 RepID=A0A1G8SJW7_9FLAO|nr:response regulator transcription factor [Flavobacterium noncentrifugens]GEP49864.1 oxygen regulatory protein NreC [Flavobacterium noncentrifugens]SDJ29529.1 two component transcriptional regulator, LuxR family [Flavobacterium noncentrifugens]
MIQTAITDDHTIVIEGIKTMLKSNKDIEILQSFTTIHETMESLSDSIQVLLLDINLPDGNGILACKDLLKKYPKLKIIALTNFEDSSFIRQIMKNGASGYLLKNTDKTELVTAIKTVLEGDNYLPQNIREILLNESIGKGNSSYFIPKLTSREKEILDLVIKEFTTEEMATALFISVKTVEAHRSNLIQKLGVKNTAGLVRVAFEKGLV